MTLSTKLTWISLALTAVILTSFVVWGGAIEQAFSQDASAETFERLYAIGWLIAMGLLIGDILLPVPGTPIMAALGIVYGPLLGGAIGAAGLILSALLGYGLSRWASVKAARFLGTPAEREQFQGLFDRYGMLAIIASRALPVLPEVITVLAGLAPMKLSRFMLAVVIGSVPAALLFAYIGYAAAEHAWWAVALATAIPMVIYLLLLALAKKQHRNTTS